MEDREKVINVGSGKSMLSLNNWDTAGITIVGVNNVWKGTNKWDHILYPHDYLEDIPINENQMKHSREYNWCIRTPMKEISNKPDSQVTKFLGPTMYFTAAYWTLYYLKPKFLGFIGFDMNYTPDNEGNTAFYGKGIDIQRRGIPDPFYQMRFFDGDPKDNLNIFFERLDSNRGECKLFNLSDDPNTLLPWEKISFEDFKTL